MESSSSADRKSDSSDEGKVESMSAASYYALAKVTNGFKKSCKSKVVKKEIDRHPLLCRVKQVALSKCIRNENRKRKRRLEKYLKEDGQNNVNSLPEKR